MLQARAEQDFERRLRAELAPYLPIEDYAVIGDCRSAALVSRFGSIDWLCLPHFDSPALFAAILDHERGGRFSIRPTVPARTERRYVGDSAVLETRFIADRGTVVLRDALTVTSQEGKRRQMWPDRELLRCLECTEGELELELRCRPRGEYGQRALKLRDRGNLGWVCQRRGQALVVRSEARFEAGDDNRELRARVRLRAGDRIAVSLVYAYDEPAVLTPLGEAAHRRMQGTVDWWQGWAKRCEYQGRWREPVMRGLLTLKQMIFAPSGAVVAAPTTSLPEEVGGERNWDYRYTWIRDASMTVRTLFDLGYGKEARAFLGWLLHTTRRTRPELKTMYDVFGSPHLPERELALDGYAGSRPVRVGNAAVDQLQLDTYGELIDAVHDFTCRGGELDRPTAKLLVGFGEVICKQWRRRDRGIWEVRGEPRNFTSSKALCWAALNELLELHQHGHLEVSVDRLCAVRDEIREAIETYGKSERLGCYTQAFDGEQLDASLLLLPMYGYCDYDDPTMLRTTDLIAERLCENRLVHRYLGDDGLAGQEGAFGICTSWYVTCRARQGQLDEAEAYFDNLLAYANDVGLFSEEVDPENGMLLGNFPQAYTHLGIIDAALTLEECEGWRQRKTEQGAEGGTV